MYLAVYWNTNYRVTFTYAHTHTLAHHCHNSRPNQKQRTQLNEFNLIFMQISNGLTKSVCKQNSLDKQIEQCNQKFTNPTQTIHDRIYINFKMIRAHHFPSLIFGGCFYGLNFVRKYISILSSDFKSILFKN